MTQDSGAKALTHISSARGSELEGSDEVSSSQFRPRYMPCDCVRDVLGGSGIKCNTAKLDALHEGIDNVASPHTWLVLANYIREHQESSSALSILRGLFDEAEDFSAVVVECRALQLIRVDCVDAVERPGAFEVDQICSRPADMACFAEISD